MPTNKNTQPDATPQPPQDNPVDPPAQPAAGHDIQALRQKIEDQQELMHKANTRLLQACAGMGAVVSMLAHSYEEADAGRYSVLQLLKRELEDTAAMLEP